MPSPSGSVISVVEALQPWKLPATCTPLLSIALFATSQAMFTLRVTSIEHASQELQQTTGRTVSAAGIVNTRLVFVALPLVQDAVGSFISWMLQPSAEYLNSTVVPCSKGRVTSQMLSPLASLIALQLPHQLFHVPFTSGVVKPWVTLFMSTWKV